MAKTAKKTTKKSATRGATRQPKYPKAGAVTRSTEGSHELVSHGDGTARETPIVNSQGQFPPRSEPGDEADEDDGEGEE